LAKSTPALAASARPRPQARPSRAESGAGRLRGHRADRGRLQNQPRIPVQKNSPRSLPNASVRVRHAFDQQVIRLRSFIGKKPESRLPDATLSCPADMPWLDRVSKGSLQTVRMRSGSAPRRLPSTSSYAGHASTSEMTACACSSLRNTIRWVQNLVGDANEGLLGRQFMDRVIPGARVDTQEEHRWGFSHAVPVTGAKAAGSRQGLFDFWADCKAVQFRKRRRRIADNSRLAAEAGHANRSGHLRATPRVRR